MSKKEQIVELMTAFENKGMIFYNDIPFNWSGIDAALPDGEKLSFVTFPNERDIMWVCSKTKENKRNYYSLGRGDFNTAMLDAAIVEMTAQMMEIDRLTKIVNECEDSKLEETLLEVFIKPYMARMYKKYSNSPDYYELAIKRKIRRFGTTPSVSVGKRGCDTESEPYKAITIGNSYGDYCGGMTIARTDKGYRMKQFVPLAGECRWECEPEKIIANVKHAIDWICS